MTEERADRLGRLAPLLIFGVACAVYAQTVGFDFVGDDLSAIRDRGLFHDLSRWREILTTPWWPHALYRPLTGLSLALNWAAVGDDPGVFHAVNVALHGVVSLLVYRLARDLTTPLAALAAGLLFAVHPVHVEPVVNVVGRAEILSALFGLSAVLLYRWDGRLADAGDHRSWARVLASLGTLGSIGLALAAKESAFAVPGLLLLVDWYEGARQERRLGEVVGRHGVLWGGSVAVCVAWLIFRAGIVNDLTGLEAAPGLEYQGLVSRAVIMLPIVLQYVRLLFVPARLSVEYSPDFLPAITSFSLRGLAGAGVIVAALALAWRARRRAPSSPSPSRGWLRP